MTAQSTEDVSIWITTGSPTELTVSSATKAAPAVVTVTSNPDPAIVDGDLCYIYETESDNLNGIWAGGSASAATFAALSSNTTNDTVAVASGKVDHYEQGDLTKLCLSAININGTEPNTISVATFCSPTATIDSQVQEAGTLTMEGYVDVTSPDYPALYEACLLYTSPSPRD